MAESDWVDVKDEWVDAPPPGYAEDIVKGAAGGLGRGVAGTIGLPGMVGELGARGLDWATRKIGGALGVDVAPREDRPLGADAAAAQKAIEGYTGKFYEPQTVPGQYASTIGEFAPSALIPGGGGIAARALNVVAPALLSESAGQLTKGTDIEPWARAGAGIVGGLGAAKLITPTAPATAARQANVQTLEDVGIRPTAGQRTGSKPIQWIEATAADQPFSASAAKAINDRQAAGFERAVTEQTYSRPALTARGVPENVNLPDPRVVRAGRQSLEDEYTRLTSGNTLRSDPQLITDIHRAEDAYARNALPASRSTNVEQLREDIVNRLLQHQGQLPGDVYQATRSRLGKLAQSSGSDTYQADALRDMRGALDRAMHRSLPPEDSAAWALNNARYANMKRLEDAVARNNENLTPLSVAQGARGGRASQFAAQQTDLDQLAGAAAAVLKPLPSSGTAQRQLYQSLFSGGTGGVIGGLVGGGPGVAIGSLLGAAVPGAVGRAVLSRPGQAYLGNQLAPQTARDVIAQTLAEQAIAQPSIVRRNEAEREDRKRRRALGN